LRGGRSGEGGGRGKGGEMTQTLYAYMNKRKKKTLEFPGGKDELWEYLFS
jgi:hypothetical protein